MESTNEEIVNIAEKKSGWRKISTNLKRALLVGTSFAVGGYSQWSGELDKILGRTTTEPGKFPRGLADFNPTEEILEGGLPSAVGALSALFLYRLICARTGQEYNPKTEVEMMVTGSLLGYVAMASISGPVLHAVLDVPDVKWGPFK